MSNFKIFSFADLMCGSHKDEGRRDKNSQQEHSVAQKPQTPRNGVYIQDISGKLWEIKEWDDSVKPNAIAVIDDEAKFLIALREFELRLSDDGKALFRNYMAKISCETAAKADYNGAGNTSNMLKAESDTSYAAGFCNSFTFPNGKPKGYLPSLGQLNLAYHKKHEICDALNKCGGAAMSSDYHWSSTFHYARESYSINCGMHACWMLNWKDGIVKSYYSDSRGYVRPFANLQ